MHFTLMAPLNSEIICRKFLINRDLCPARMPDLTQFDYYRFPHLKNTVFKEPVHTIDEF
jgi:hypothetical protein